MYLHSVLLCYLDESGDEQPLRTPTDPPVLVLGGVVVDHERARTLTYDFLQLKKRFRPQLDNAMWSEVIRHEVKGSDLRKSLRDGGRNNQRATLGFLDKLLGLLESANAKVVARVHVKGIDPLGEWVYPKTVAELAADFEKQLATADVRGAMILDSRTKSKNTPSVHRLTTERFRSGGDPYPHLVESPVFGHSDTHVILQVADLVVSGLLFPMACAAYCDCLWDNVHFSPGYGALREKFGVRLQLLEHRYLQKGGSHGGGVRVLDKLNGQPTLALFREVPFDAAKAELVENRRKERGGQQKTT